jgi:hypothetical protein
METSISSNLTGVMGEVEKFVCDCGKVFEVQVETEV